MFLAFSQSLNIGRLDSIFGWDKRQQQIIGTGFATNGVAGSGWTLRPEDGKLEIAAAASSVWVFKTQANDTLVLEDANRASTEYRRIAGPKRCSE